MSAEWRPLVEHETSGRWEATRNRDAVYRRAASCNVQQRLGYSWQPGIIRSIFQSHSMHTESIRPVQIRVLCAGKLCCLDVVCAIHKAVSESCLEQTHPYGGESFTRCKNAGPSAQPICPERRRNCPISPRACKYTVVDGSWRKSSQVGMGRALYPT